MRQVRWFALVVIFGLAYAFIAFSTRSTSAPAVAQAQPRVVPFTLKIVCGLKDPQPTVWEGSVQATNANVDRIDGWRFLPNEDRITAPTAWRLRTDPAVVQPTQPTQPTTPNGVLIFGTASEGASFEVTTNRGLFSFNLSELKLGQPQMEMGGEVSIELLPATTKLTDDLREDDFPSVAVDSDGTAWAAWQSYSGLRDEIRLRRYANGRWHTFTRVPDVSGDVWRPQVAVDANHIVWVVWAQQVKGNWDIYARAFDGQYWRNEVRLTDDPLPDINHHVITTSAGNLCVVWQGFRDLKSQIPNPKSQIRAQSDIFLKHYDHYAYRWSDEVRVSSSPANDWDPAVAADSKGNAWVVWDTYEKGNYDVHLRQIPLPPKLPQLELPTPVIASTPQAEMRATVACDRADRVWVAYEVARPNWGKDQGYTIRQNPFGVPLGGPRSVEVRVVENGVVKEPAAQPSTAMPLGERQFFYTPHLIVEGAGRVWLAVRHKGVRGIRNPQGQVQQRNFWEEWLTRYDGDKWTPVMVMPNSMGRQSILSDIAAGQDGNLWLAWTTDNRQYQNLHRPIHHEVYAASIKTEGDVKEPVLRDVPSYNPEPTTQNPPLGEHANEATDVAAVRDYRAKVGNVTCQIVRGDLHRHTELSWDGGGGNDGSAIDFYRYMIDAAAMDYGAITDHNAGGDYEYWWWLTEKLADLYHAPGAYVPLFAYERSVVYPNGHRNVVHSYRGVPVVSFFTTPTLTGDRPGVGTGDVLDNDTKLLYGELRKSKGIAISHTSATRMGTDWRDNDKQLEPVVEIFQGCRTNYEYAGAPKSADPQRDAQHINQAGYQPAGFVWNAWKKGYRLGVITSSDHGSTHISYAMVYAQTPTREGILNAIRKRHTYGATDNIILEFRIGDAFMGDEITGTTPPLLWIKVRGTNELSRVDIVKNNEFIYTTDPKGRNTTFTFHDNKTPKGASYYYIRVQQEDGQIAWSSPIWVEFR